MTRQCGAVLSRCFCLHQRDRGLWVAGWARWRRSAITSCFIDLAPLRHLDGLDWPGSVGRNRPSFMAKILPSIGRFQVFLIGRFKWPETLVLQGFHAFCVVFFLYRKLPFVGFFKGGELKKNLQVGSIYLRAKKKRVNPRPVLLSFFSPRQQAQIRPELLDKQREKTPAAPSACKGSFLRSRQAAA